MRVWTDGSTHLVLGPGGLTRHSRGKAETIPLGEAAPGVRGRIAWHARGVLAVDPASRKVWAEWAGKLRELALEGPASPKPLDWKAKDMAVREDGTAVAVLDAGKGKGKLVAGPVPADGVWKKTLALPEPVKVKWPSGVIWAKGTSAPWRAKKGLGHDAYISTNEFGISVSERSSGIVAVVRPDATEVDFAVRFPTQDEADLTATATPQGVLVVLCIEGRHAAALHVDARGALLGSLSRVQTELEEELAWGMGPPVLVSATKAFLVHEYTIPQVLDLSLPELKIETTWELPATSEGEKSAAAAKDGRACLLGFGGETWMLTRTASGWQLDELGVGRAGRAPGGPAGAEPDIDIAAALKAALGGGSRAPAPPVTPSGTAGRKKAPREPGGEAGLPTGDEDAWESAAPGKRRSRKKDSGIAELDVEELGFGPLQDELDEDMEGPEDTTEAEGMHEAREPGEEDEEEDAGGEDEESAGTPPRAAGAARQPSIEGDPALTLVAQPGGPKTWSGKRGTPLVIDLGFGNVGGPSKGIFLEVEGGPIGAKKLVPRAVRVGDLRVAFGEPKGNKARVEMKEVALQAGAANEKAGQPPVPSAVLVATVEFDAPQAADDLLLVRMGPLRVPRPGAGAFTHGKRLLIA